MRNLFALFGVAMTAAFSIGGCALAGDGDMASADGEKGEANADEFAYVDDGADPAADKSEKEAPLTVKGAWEETRPKGTIYHRLVNVPQGTTLSCSTSGGSGPDTVLAIVRFHSDYTTGDSAYNMTLWPGSGGEFSHVYGLHTLAFNDDISSSNRYSRVSYTGDVYGGANVYVVGFSYGYSVGTADVTCNIGGTESGVSFWAGSNQRACDQGQIQFTNSGMDTTLLGIDPNVVGGDTRINEDISGSDYRSRIPNAPGGAIWWVHGTWSENGGDQSNLKCSG